jgi:hypothetical protein
MNGNTLRILKMVSKRGEVSLRAAIELGATSHGDHRDQYPLALLLEDGYLGVTLNHIPPSGAEEMREFSLATTLHMFTLPKNVDGTVHYLGSRTSGGLDPEKLRVFLKAKGALYLDEQAQKFWDRLWSFVLGVSAGLLIAVGAAWLKAHLKLP